MMTTLLAVAVGLVVRKDAVVAVAAQGEAEAGIWPFAKDVAEFSADPDPDPSWELLSSDAACGLGSDRSPQDRWTDAAAATNKTEVALAECMRGCREDPGCVAVDWYAVGGTCVHHAAGCLEPAHRPTDWHGKPKGARSYVLSAPALQAKACAAWSGAMSWLGPGWHTTDVDDIADVLDREFGAHCADDDEVEILFAQRDVGRNSSGTFMGGITNTIVRAKNQYSITHSGVRLHGCGRSLMLQLQSRNWGWDGSAGEMPFATSFAYPNAAPDQRTMWAGVKCGEGDAEREQGAGVVIYYRALPEEEKSPWHLGEKQVGKLTKARAFVAGLAPALRWWNVDARYQLESLKSLSPSGPELLHNTLTCDTFSLWTVAQAVAFAGPREDVALHWNRVDVKLTEPANIVSGTAEALRAENPDMHTALLRYFSLQQKGKAYTGWSVQKGHGDCTSPGHEVEAGEAAKVQNVEERVRQMRDPKEWTTWWGWTWSCVDRITDVQSVMGSGFDMRRFGPWRFFPSGKGEYMAALEWETEVWAAYEPWTVYSAKDGKVQLPGGTPRQPFAQDAAPNPCGSRCAWAQP